MKIFNNNTRGFSALAALLTVMSLTSLAGVMAYTVAGGYLSHAHQITSTQAFYVTQAGIEYAIKKITSEEEGNVTNFAFGPGTFTTSHNGITLTTTGTVAEATRQHLVDNPSQEQCLAVDVDNTHLTQGDKRLMLITFRKKCLNQISVTNMKYSWVPDNGEKLKEIKIENNVVYSDAVGSLSGTDLDIVPDQVLVNGANNVVNWIEFSADVDNKTFTYDWTLGDASHATGTFVTED